MKTLLILLKKDLLEAWRTKKVLILSIVFLFCAVSSPLFAKITPKLLESMPSQGGITIKIPEPTYRDAIDQWVKNVSQFGLLVLLFIGAAAIVEEKNRKTLELLLTKPAPRPYIVLSKLKSLFLVTTVLYAIASVIFYVYAASLFEPFSIARFALVDIFMWFYLLAVMVIAVLGSVVASNLAGAIGLNFLSLIVVTAIIPMVGKLAPYWPSYLMQHYKDVMNQGWNSNYIIPLCVELGLMALFVLASVLIFQKQEIER